MDTNLPVTPTTPTIAANASASGRSLAALILGIASLLCCGFFTGIPALILGKAEENAIHRGEAPESGRVLAKIGWILGLAGTLLNCLSLIGMGLYFWKFGVPQIPQSGF